MARYAKNTSVPISRSKAQIEETLLRYGIKEFGMGVSPRGDGIIFKKDGRMYKINVPNPEPDDYSTDVKYEQARRQRWRILLLSIKAKLEEVEAGLISFDDQFLVYMALPDGSTVGDFMRLPENAKRLSQTKMPKLLSGI